MRTEIPIPICAAAGAENDSTETVSIKTPNTPTPNLRTERFIFIASLFLWSFSEVFLRYGRAILIQRR
jgi:hypothetical protein